MNERDNPVTWNQLKSVPAGIADGVDNGITGIIFARVIGPEKTIAPGEYASTSAICLPGAIVTGGGFYSSSETDFHLSLSVGEERAWGIGGTNTGVDNLLISAHAVCLSTPVVGPTTAGTG